MFSFVKNFHNSLKGVGKAGKISGALLILNIMQTHLKLIQAHKIVELVLNIN